MTERTINEEIQIMIDHTLNQQLKPMKCTVIKNYGTDKNHVDIETDMGNLTFVECINSNKVGNKGILIYLENNTPFAIIDSR